MLRIVLSTAIAGLLGLLGCGGDEPREAPQSVRVLDPAAALDPPSRSRLDRYLEWMAADRGIDCRVVVAATGGLPVTEAERWFRELDVGRATDGRGLLLWIDPEGRRARIEVGYALEGLLPDLSAGWILDGYVAPHARDDALAAGLEAAIEGLVDRVAPRRAELAASDATPGSGGAGADADLSRASPASDGVSSRLAPQPDPRAVRDLELEMLRAGRYDADAPIYDDAWRHGRRPRFGPQRLREIARRFDRAYEIVSDGEHAVAWYPGVVDLGPTLLRREPEGWIIDATAGARLIVYDYSNERWYLVDEPSPYVPLVRSVYLMRKGRLGSGRVAWIVTAEGS